jgi:hypothetical protein
METIVYLFAGNYAACQCCLFDVLNVHAWKESGLLLHKEITNMFGVLLGENQIVIRCPGMERNHHEVQVELQPFTVERMQKLGEPTSIGITASVSNARE